ncbi:MAG: hypothetical protein R3B53_00655 [Candidatus Paceibacterota bacterium]
MKYLLLLSLLLLVPGGTSLAQTGLSVGGESLSIVLDPLFPTPESKFTATADDYALPSQGNSIRWYVDGKLLTESANKREITLTAKKVGVPTTIELVVGLNGGASASVKKVVNPAYLDLIIEPQTRIPSFYKGRALPSVGSLTNVTAIINAGEVTPANLMYNWRLNGKALENGSVRGRNNITFAMPQGPYATLSLEVTTLSGEVIARRIFDIQSLTPTLSFYEMSTLYGLREKSVGGGLSLIGNSVTVKAEPYYLDLRTYNYPDLTEWRINGLLNDNNSNNPYEITLANGGGGGIGSADFHVRDTTQLLQGARANFQINF